MYESYYGIRARPFSILPDPQFIYLGRKHRLAADLLEYGLTQSAAFSVISGEIGTGKTTLIRRLLGQVGSDTRIGMIANTHTPGGGLLRRILHSFGIQVDAGDELRALSVFESFLDQLEKANRRALLLIDEAQKLPVEALEELRTLSNVNTEDTRFQVVLAGQPGLRDNLLHPDLVQFAQRIAVDYHLEPLDRSETASYIRHRLSVAGSSVDELFEDGACEAVFAHTGGVPRLINILCENALVYGYADQKPRIDADTINEVARDRRKGGVLPLTAQTTCASANASLS